MTALTPEELRNIFFALSVPPRLDVLKYVAQHDGATHKDLMADFRTTHLLWRPLNALCKVGLLRREVVDWKDVRYHLRKDTVEAVKEVFEEIITD